jgi:hypothetical protein
MKKGPNKPTTESIEHGNTSVRRQARRIPKWLNTALTLAALYLLLLLGFSRLAPLVTVPDEAIALTPAGGGLGAAVHQFLGRLGGTDFLVDYASAYALVHHGDAYEITEKLSERVGAHWEVSTANPHPPTMLPFILPFLAGDYRSALGAWSLAMLFVLILSVRFLDVPGRSRAGSVWLSPSVFREPTASAIPFLSSASASPSPTDGATIRFSPGWVSLSPRLRKSRAS